MPNNHAILKAYFFVVKYQPTHTDNKAKLDESELCPATATKTFCCVEKGSPTTFHPQLFVARVALWTAKLSNTHSNTWSDFLLC
jgi:hypothetical protein